MNGIDSRICFMEIFEVSQNRIKLKNLFKAKESFSFSSCSRSLNLKGNPSIKDRLRRLLRLNLRKVTYTTFFEFLSHKYFIGLEIFFFYFLIEIVV